MSIFALGACVIFAWASTAGAELDETATDSRELSRTLHRLAQVAQFYAEGALEFTCTETVRYQRGRRPMKSLKYDYIYRKENGSLDDYRTSTNFGERRDHDARSSYPGPAIILRPYSWIFSFGSARQEYYSYRILGTETVLDRRAVMVWIEPTGRGVPAADVNDWVGTFWIDSVTHQILKVEVFHLAEYRNQLALDEAFQRAVEGADEESWHTVERISTSFEVLERGLRYPSKVVIERRNYKVPYDTDPAGGLREYRVEQTFSNYRFYSTETSEQMDEVVTDR